ncbi:MAG: MFS transporter [Anaerolineaceae bacterium]|nr:MAG: MFS transporter [Anaerolineaceae bacterium]
MLSRLFRQSSIPREYRANFLHLYLDIGWFGILGGSAINFLAIYAARLGASALQIGLIGAASAVVNLLIAIPSGNWVAKRNTGLAVFWSSVFYRLGYALWIPLPWLFNAQGQVWALIIVTFLMAIPLTPLGVGFNALFAEAVPSEYRAHVAGVRNIVLSVAFITSSLLSGYILEAVTFPAGYQIVFGIGFFGAAMSSLHLYFVRPLKKDRSSRRPDLSADSASQADSPRGLVSSLRLDVVRGPFGKVVVVMLFFHLAHYIASPIYPLYNVNVLHLNDDHIGIGTALFYLTVLIGSTRLNRLVGRMGHRRVTGWGMIGMALYPFILGLSQTVWQFYAVSLIGGFTWGLAGGAYANYLLEEIPEHDRPAHLAWYNIALNAAILAGSFLGPLIANLFGLVSALMLFAVMRMLAGVSILRRG